MEQLMFLEEAREIPVIGNVDVLVLGGGPAGVGAAVAAAREGAAVMLIEQTGDVGGVATSGMMSHWTGGSRGGLYEEILDRSCDVRETDGGGPANRQTIHTERLKTALLDMLSEARVSLLLYTFACEPILEGSALKGVIIENKSGRQAVFSKIVIDATGDGDLAARAGVPFVIGREEDGVMQPATIMFKVGGVDYDRAVFPKKFEDYIQVPKGEIQALGHKHLPFPAGHVLLYPTTLPGVVTCNMTNCIGIDGTQAEDLVKATVVCRKQLDSIIRFLRHYVPGYENCFLLASAPFLGIRETRHFKGVKTITEEDIREARIFEDWAVTYASFNFDIHNTTGAGLDKTGEQAAFRATFYTIPYGCLIPQGIDRLLLAGRNISGTHMAHSNYRAMPICVHTGQAAGTAAALCAQKNLSPRSLDVNLLQKRLLANGVLPVSEPSCP